MPLKKPPFVHRLILYALLLLLIVLFSLFLEPSHYSSSASTVTASIFFRSTLYFSAHTTMAVDLGRRPSLAAVSVAVSCPSVVSNASKAAPHAPRNSPAAVSSSRRMSFFVFFFNKQTTSGRVGLKPIGVSLFSRNSQRYLETYVTDYASR